MFDASNGITMTIADMGTMKPTGTITFSDHVRVFVINHDATRVYANLNNLLGFEIADVKTHKVIKRVEAPGEMWKSKWANPNLHFFGHGAPMHGIAMTPDESEIWIPDAINNQVLVYDNRANGPSSISASPFRPRTPMAGSCSVWTASGPIWPQAMWWTPRRTRSWARSGTSMAAT